MAAVRASVVMAVAFAVCCACSKPAPPRPDNWAQAAISSLTQQQKRWYDADKAKGKDSPWMLTTPNPPATDANIQDAQRRAGVTFDAQYIEWLHHADGWKFFSGADTLYRTSELSKDSNDRKILLGVIAEYGIEPDDLEMDSFDRLVVIGGASGDYFIVTTGCAGAACASAPVWEIASGDHAKYDSFKEFIQARIERMTKAQR